MKHGISDRLLLISMFIMCFWMGLNVLFIKQDVKRLLPVEVSEPFHQDMGFVDYPIRPGPPMEPEKRKARVR